MKYVDGPVGDDGKPGRRRLVTIPPGDVPSRHDHWRARTRYRFPSGKLKQIERFGTSPAKAEASLKLALVSIQESEAVDIKRETNLRDLSDRFLETGRAPRTVDTYAQSIRKIIVPRIGDLSVSEATPERLQRFLDAVTEEHGPGSAKTARAVLSGMLGLATRSDALRHNPVRELAPLERKPEGAKPIPLDELAGLLAKVRADERLKQLDLVDLVEFVAGTGARISEACALSWEDVDLEAGTATIRANALRATGKGVIRQEHTKTDAGARRIRLPAAVLGILGDRRVRAARTCTGSSSPLHSGTSAIRGTRLVTGRRLARGSSLATTRSTRSGRRWRRRSTRPDSRRATSPSISATLTRR